MKSTIIKLMLICTPLTGVAATDYCKDQLADVSASIEMARMHGNSAEIARLKIARDKIETYCTDERQATRASHDVNKRKMKVKKAELELQEARQDLAEARADGRAERIIKKTHKVEEKKRKLESAKIDLKQAQDEAKRLN